MRERTLRRWGASCGLGGALLLAVYFAAPALTNWPFAGAPPASLLAYATAHEQLFYLGAWLQAVGALLCVLFFLILVELGAGHNSLAGFVCGAAAAVLLSVVVIDAAFMTAVPMAAATGDAMTVSAMFTLSNGVFVRIFPLVPAPAIFGGIAAALWRRSVLPQVLCWMAWILAALFQMAAIVAILSQAGFVAEIVLSILQEIWILAASVALLRRQRQ